MNVRLSNMLSNIYWLDNVINHTRKAHNVVMSHYLNNVRRFLNYGVILGQTEIRF